MINPALFIGLGDLDRDYDLRNRGLRVYPGAGIAPGIIFIFTTGLLGMSIDVFGLYVFQSMFGYVYQEAGLIVAVFMMGLTLGGLAGTMIVGRTSRPARCW